MNNTFCVTRNEYNALEGLETHPFILRNGLKLYNGNKMKQGSQLGNVGARTQESINAKVLNAHLAHKDFKYFPQTAKG